VTTSQGESSPEERTGTSAEPAPGSELSPRSVSGVDAQETAPLTGSIAAPPDDARQLELEIKRIREQLGETVQELVARVDVKARARAKASDVSGRLKNTVVQARDSAATRGVRERWMPLAVSAGVFIVGVLVAWQWHGHQRGVRGKHTARSAFLPQSCHSRGRHD